MNTNTTNICDNIKFPTAIGRETKEHKKKRERYQKMKEILGDKDFYKIISEKEYKDFIEEKYLDLGGTIAQDLISVKPLSAPSLDLMYMDVIYENENDKQTRLALEKQKLRLKKLEEILKSSIHVNVNVNVNF